MTFTRPHQLSSRHLTWLLFHAVSRLRHGVMILSQLPPPHRPSQLDKNPVTHYNELVAPTHLLPLAKRVLLASSQMYEFREELDGYPSVSTRKGGDTDTVGSHFCGKTATSIARTDMNGVSKSRPLISSLLVSHFRVISSLEPNQARYAAAAMVIIPSSGPTTQTLNSKRFSRPTSGQRPYLVR